MGLLPLPPVLKITEEMNALSQYSIPIQGLKAGVHHFKFELDAAFFAHFEDSPVSENNIRLEVQLDKRADMLLFEFDLTGTVRAECDRCTVMIDLPLESTRQLIVKYGEADGETEDEVVFIQRDSSDFNVAKYIYEFSILALPITNTYDCKNDVPPPCNQEVLKYLSNESIELTSNSAWDALKGFNNN